MGDWRERWLDLSIACGVAVVVVTESLGAFSWLSTWAVRAIWLAWLVVVAAVVLRRKRCTGSNLQQSAASLALSSRIVLAGLAAMAILVGISALCAPPNAIDSLNYHMSRVANWQQRQSVDAYATGYLPQLYQPPWAEFAILNLQIAVGSDLLAGTVQWVSMLCSLIVVSSIAGYLGASTTGQVLAAAFGAALPTGILEGSGALNDWVATLWLAAFGACVLRLWTQPARRGWVGYAFTGAALGLALGTKGTNYIYAVGFVVLLLGVSFRDGFTRHLPHLALVGALVVALNSAYFARNYRLFGAVLGPGVDDVNGSSYFVGAITWNGFLSNVARNLELEIATPDPIFNRELFNHIEQFHDWIGIATDSQLTTWNESSFKPARLSFHETQAGNLLAVIVLTITLVAATAGGQLVRDRRLRLYACTWVAGLLLFCLLLKWQPWNVRLLLTWLVLGAPIVGSVWTQRSGHLGWFLLGAAGVGLGLRTIFERGEVSPARVVAAAATLALIVVLSRLISARLPPTQRPTVLGAVAVRYVARWTHAYGAVVLAVALLIAGLPWALWNETRPILGDQSVLRVPRLDQYFVNAPDLEAPYLWAADRIAREGCTRVGLVAGPGSIDYPLWVLLRASEPSVTIEDVLVANVSAVVTSANFAPCAMLTLAPAVPKVDLVYANRRFTRVFDTDTPESTSPSMALFLPAP